MPFLYFFSYLAKMVYLSFGSISCSVGISVFQRSSAASVSPCFEGPDRESRRLHPRLAIAAVVYTSEIERDATVASCQPVSQFYLRGLPRSLREQFRPGRSSLSSEQSRSGWRQSRGNAGQPYTTTEVRKGKTYHKRPPLSELVNLKAPNMIALLFGAPITKAPQC